MAQEILSDWDYLDSYIKQGSGYWLFRRQSMGQTLYYAFKSAGSFASPSDQKAIEQFRRDNGAED